MKVVGIVTVHKEQTDLVVAEGLVVRDVGLVVQQYYSLIAFEVHFLREGPGVGTYRIAIGIGGVIGVSEHNRFHQVYAQMAVKLVPPHQAPCVNVIVVIMVAVFDKVFWCIGGVIEQGVKIVVPVVEIVFRCIK